MRVFVCARA